MKKLFEVLEAKSNIALILGGLLATGGTGYIFAALYFVIIESNPFYEFFNKKHKSLLINSTELIEIVDSTNQPIAPEKLSERESWEVLAQFWHTEKEKSDDLKGIDPYVDRVVDMIHSLGTSVTGSIIAFLFWNYVHFLLQQDTSFNVTELCIILLWLILISIFLRNYKSTQRSIQALINSTARKVFQTKFETSKTKTNIYYVK